jgi:hypothetical protein
MAIKTVRMGTLGYRCDHLSAIPVR